jgi:hypothetical protein
VDQLGLVGKEIRRLGLGGVVVEEDVLLCAAGGNLSKLMRGGVNAFLENVHVGHVEREAGNMKKCVAQGRGGCVGKT